MVLKAYMTSFEIRTHGPMKYFRLKRIIEEELRLTGLTKGLVTIHVKGATPGLLIFDEEHLQALDNFLKKLVPITGYRHSNAHEHLRSSIMSTTHTLFFDSKGLRLPPSYEVFLVETRPVHNHKRVLHLIIRGI